MRKEGRGKMKRATFIFIAAAVIAGNGCGNSSVASGPDAKQPSASTSAVAAPAPAAKPAETSDTLSVLTVEHQVDLSSQSDGAVTSVVKDEGSIVKAGDILGRLDDTTLQMELIKARDDLKVTENNLQYKAAELKAKAAAYRRQQLLRDNGLSSQADLEAAEFEAKGAEYDMHGYEALVESGNAEIHRLEIEIDRKLLRAPFSGVVVRRYIREGQTINKGDKCFRVSQLYPLQVQFQVPESSARKPVVGAPVDLSLVGGATRELSAKVVKVSPTIDPASDSYDVVAQVTSAGISDLRPGMAVRVGWPATGKSKP